MCLILFAWHAHPGFPLVFAGNRDEAHARPSAPAGFWSDDPEIFGGRDLEKGGTWLGVARSGRLAAITNYRDGTAAKNAPRSRGQLAADFLRSTEDPRAFLERVAARTSDYGGFSLIVSDLQRMFWMSNRNRSIGEVLPGVHGLSNHLLDTPWPKITRGKERISALMRSDEASLIPGLQDVLADRTVAADSDLPDTGIGLQRERELSPAFIAGERYGTRASTVLLVSNRNEVVCIERRFGAGGAPQGEAKERFALYIRGSGRNTNAAGQVT